MIIDIVRGIGAGKSTEFHFYHQFHHVLCHGWPAALVLCSLLAAFGKDRWRVLAFCLVTFHLHLLCDLLGSRGPSLSDVWPINYGEPLFRHPIWIWRAQWRLDGWQNGVLFVLLFAGALRRSVRFGHSFAEVLGPKADETFVRVLRKWRDDLWNRSAKS